jgi:hypothetical protein
VGHVPKCRSYAFTEGPEKSSGVLSDQDFEGNRNPQGGPAEAEERAAAGRMESPEAVPEHETGYGTADTYRSKVFIYIPVLEKFYRHRSYHRATKGLRKEEPSPHLLLSSLALTQTHDFRKFFDGRSRVYRSQSIKHGMRL